MKANNVGREVGRSAGRGFVAAVLVAVMASAGSVAVAAEGDGAQWLALPSVPALIAEPSVIAAPAPAPMPAPAPAPAPALVPVPVPAPTPAPSDVVREAGAWFAHGYTLDLHDDGTGQFASWHGAFDGTTIELRLIPAPGTATVAEVISVSQVGAGAIAPAEQPGVGGLVTLMFADVPVTESSPVPEGVRTAHFEWTSGANRHAVDLCPTTGIDAEQMTMLRCGA